MRVAVIIVNYNDADEKDTFSVVCALYGWFVLFANHGCCVSVKIHLVLAEGFCGYHQGAGGGWGSHCACGDSGNEETFPFRYGCCDGRVAG